MLHQSVTSLSIPMLHQRMVADIQSRLVGFSSSLRRWKTPTSLAEMINSKFMVCFVFGRLRTTNLNPFKAPEFSQVLPLKTFTVSGVLSGLFTTALKLSVTAGSAPSLNCSFFFGSLGNRPGTAKYDGHFLDPETTNWEWNHAERRGQHNNVSISYHFTMDITYDITIWLIVFPTRVV